MTKLLRLLNHIFANQSNQLDLEQYIRSFNPMSIYEVEALTRDYLYNRASLRGAE